MHLSPRIGGYSMLSHDRSAWRFQAPSNRRATVNATNTHPSADETETWEAWLDGKRDEAMHFEAPAFGTFDIADAGAAALGVDVCDELNVARV